MQFPGQILSINITLQRLSGHRTQRWLCSSGSFFSRAVTITLCGCSRRWRILSFPQEKLFPDLLLRDFAVLAGHKEDLVPHEDLFSELILCNFTVLAGHKEYSTPHDIFFLELLIYHVAVEAGSKEDCVPRKFSI